MFQILFLCFPSLFFAMIASTVESKYSLAKMRLEKGQGTVENSLPN